MTVRQLSAALAVAILALLVGSRLTPRKIMPANDKQSSATGIANKIPAAPSTDEAEADVIVPAFEDVAAGKGIDFTYDRGESGLWWPVEPVGGGVGWIDFDSDGLLDLVLINGAKLPVDPAARFLATRLYHNLGAGGFVDVTDEANLWSHDYGQGCAVADYNLDGSPDLFITSYGRCGLYRNNGDGTWTETTDQAGVPGGPWNTGACWADFDRDGNLDLYVANYFHFETVDYQFCRSSKGEPEYCGPSASPAIPDRLYRSRSDGTFEDISKLLSDLHPEPGPGFGGLAGDFDNDGWPDLYVANDAFANFLYRNTTGEPGKPLRFQEVGYEWGAATSADGVPQASMGVACADFDRNGYLDIALSHFIFEYSTLYLNYGERHFIDTTRQVGMAAATLPTMGWGIAFIDYDNNGWQDLFISNGHLNRSPFESQPYAMKPHFFRNAGGRKLTEMAPRAGAYFQDAWVGRGAGFADYNNDGKVDLAIVHHHRPASLLENQTRTPFQSVTLDLVGKVSNRDAINARIEIVLPEKDEEGREVVLVREVLSGDAYLSSNDRRVNAGLGPSGKALRWKVRWPSGLVQEFGELAGGSRMLLIEGEEPVIAR